MEYNIIAIEGPIANHRSTAMKIRESLVKTENYNMFTL